MSSKIYDIDNQKISMIDKNIVFALDTNILFWTHYSQASNPKLNVHPYQVAKYPNFVEQLLDNGNTLVTTVFNLTELMHVVENSEFRIYKAIRNCKIKKKDFRNILEAREKYKKEVNKILLEINSSYEGQIKLIELTNKDIQNFASQIETNTCDIFDYVVIEYLKKLNITNFITDDKDFQTIKGINVYYAHE